MPDKIPSASLVENLRLNSQVLVPNAVQGLFRRKRRAVEVATRANVDRYAVGLVDGMRRSYGNGPVWVSAVGQKALLLLSRGDLHRVLGGSPDPFAPDPPAKRDGMVAFQPDALTLSRGELWANRRRFAEGVLDTGKAHHRLAAHQAKVAIEEVEALLDEISGGDGSSDLTYDDWHRALRRATRRIVLGDSARDDEAISDDLAAMMDEGNGRPGKPSARYDAFVDGLAAYVDRAEEGSLAALSAGAPHDDATKVPAQLVHWLFAMQDTVAANSLRALALIATHPRQRAAVESEIVAAADAAPGTGALPYTAACVQEAMRLFPTTPLLSRETLTDIDWDGETVPAGTQILISNLANHRDRSSLDYADRFTPEAWTERAAGSDWTFNHFSHGPQGCPGAGIAVALGANLVAALLSRRVLRLRSPSLDPNKPLPYMLDFFALRFDLGLTPVSA
jgi:cytochrome P450